MERSEFRQRMYQFKQARESNPQLSYWEWKNSLPDNLAHTPDWQYNNFGAYTGGLKPELNEDGYYHLGSRNPYTGEILKPKSHPTYDKAIQNDVAAGYFPYEKNGITYTKTYSPTGDISGYANGTDGVQSNTSEIPVTYSNGKWNYGYNPGAGFLKPVVSIQDAADLTPVGNAITANDVYQSASQGDYITAGLIGAAALLPGAISKPLKKIVREIPSVNPKYFSDKINKVLGREVRPNGLSRDVYTDAINQRNRVIEDLYTDQDYWDRARAINEQYGDDYTKIYKGVLDTYENKYTGLPEPKAKQFFGDAKAEMAARKDAMERFRMNKIPAGYTDFEYNISPHLDRIDRPTAQHELGHYVDFNLSQNANADYNNNMFSALRRDLSTDNNPLYPDKTDYFRQGTEQKSYMNTLRSYMQSIGLMDRPGQKVTTKTIKRAINSLPSEMNAVRAAYLQFSSPGEYTKWFNKIPLLSIPGAAMYLDSKEDNSYSKGTNGIKYHGAYSPKDQAYVLPVYNENGQNNTVLPEVTVTPQNNTDLKEVMDTREFASELASYSPVGDVQDIYNIGKNVYEGNYGQAALGAGLFFLPNIASKPVKKIIKKLSLDDVKDWSDDIWDDYYNHAITNNNAEEAQHLRDLHFKSKAPNTKYDGRLYRGVTNANPIMDISKMEVLDVPGVYTTPYKKYAQSYADADDRVVFNLYGNIENPWIDTFDKKYSFLHPERVKVRMGKYKDKGNIERYNRAKEQYDAIKNTDAAYRFSYDTPNEYKSNALPQEIIIRDPNKVKSANPITYDDNGEIIPLSKRDNFNSPDIRYGLIPLLGFGLYNKYNKNKENKSN